MPKLNHPLPFLGRLGLFPLADKRVQEDSYDNLRAEFEYHVNNRENKKASLVAQKMSILYGLPGLYLYLPLKLEMLREAHAEHEIIAQALIQVLSLIFFVEKSLGHENRPEQAWATLQKDTCLTLCEAEDKDEIISDASQLSTLYLEG